MVVSDQWDGLAHALRSILGPLPEPGACAREITISMRQWLCDNFLVLSMLCMRHKLYGVSLW